MIQDIHPHLFNNKFILAHNIHDEDFIFHYKDNSLLLKVTGDNFSLPQKKDIPEFSAETESIFLFTFNNTNCFLVWSLKEVHQKQFEYQEISFFRTLRQKEIAWVSILGHQLKLWYEQNKYCGKCGSTTRVKNEERAIICNNCQTTVYPKISPAIIVAILCKDKILLAQNANFRSSFYSLVAGYADIGESLEEALIREVKEEVGLDVWNIRYYKSQPWPFSGSLMVGFIAEADMEQPICIDKTEISDAGWYSRDELPNYPTQISIAGEIIDKFKNGTLM
jgi:NAD+ diphosphatase